MRVSILFSLIALAYVQEAVAKPRFDSLAEQKKERGHVVNGKEHGKDAKINDAAVKGISKDAKGKDAKGKDAKGKDAKVKDAKGKDAAKIKDASGKAKGKLFLSELGLF